MSVAAGASWYSPPWRFWPCGTASAFGVRALILGAPVKSKIAFQSFRDGRFDAYVMNVDGSGQRRLTAKPDVVSPVWSPDGRKVAFDSVDRPFWRGNATSTS